MFPSRPIEDNISTCKFRFLSFKKGSIFRKFQSEEKSSYLFIISVFTMTLIRSFLTSAISASAFCSKANNSATLSTSFWNLASSLRLAELEERGVESLFPVTLLALKLGLAVGELAYMSGNLIEMDAFVVS